MSDEPIDHDDDIPDTIPKPDELLLLHSVAAALFDTLRRWFSVPPAVALDLADVDSAVRELGDPQMIAAMAMRKLQALHLIATPGVHTTTDVVITIIQDLDRALLQAPVMRLRVQAESTDWDDALATLSDGGDDDDTVATDATDEDPDALEFRHQHALLHEAVMAVIEASEGEIRILE